MLQKTNILLLSASILCMPLFGICFEDLCALAKQSEAKAHDALKDLSPETLEGLAQTGQAFGQDCNLYSVYCFTTLPDGGKGFDWNKLKEIDAANIVLATVRARLISSSAK